MCYFAFHVSLFLCSYYHQVARWSSHERFGPEFMALLQEFHEEHGMPEDMAKKQERTPNKTREREDGKGDSPGKAAKIDKFIPQSNLPERLNLSMQITNLKKGMLASLQIRTGNHVLYIVNENPTGVISLEPGFIVCGFGEGKFQHMAKTEGADDLQGKAVLFSMTSSEDFVILNGQWVKVGQVIRQRQNSQPSAKVAYHETRENVKAEDLTYQKWTQRCEHFRGHARIYHVYHP